MFGHVTASKEGNPDIPLLPGQKAVLLIPNRVFGSPRVPRHRARKGSSKNKGCSVQGNITPCLSPPSWQVTLQEKDLNAFVERRIG